MELPLQTKKFIMETKTIAVQTISWFRRKGQERKRSVYDDQAWVGIPHHGQKYWVLNTLINLRPSEKPPDWKPFMAAEEIQVKSCSTISSNSTIPNLMGQAKTEVSLWVLHPFSAQMNLNSGIYVRAETSNVCKPSLLLELRRQAQVPNREENILEHNPCFEHTKKSTMFQWKQSVGNVLE